MEALLLAIFSRSMVWPLLLRWLQTNNVEEIYFTLLEKENHLRPYDYCEVWLPQYIEYDFFQLFRMGQTQFQYLLAKLSPTINLSYAGGEVPVSPEKKLLMTLWWLGKNEVLLSIADKFNVSLSAVHKSVNLVLEEIVKLKSLYIVWPDKSEIQAVAQDFFARARIPGVVGAIDVCNIPFKAPADQHDSYVDRKMQHSIKLQGICSANKIFTNILVGWPGSVHDSRIFHNCEIYNHIVNNMDRIKYFPTLNHHLVGDSAYPLLDWTLTPYRDNGNLAPIQRRYNYCHSKTRIVIEHVFGILKSRWRILKYINVNSVEKAVKIIAACCVLHNFCYINGDVWEKYNEVENGNENVENNVEIDNFAVAVNKRNLIAYGLM